jgi:hypothetical protein
MHTHHSRAATLVVSVGMRKVLETVEAGILSAASGAAGVHALGSVTLTPGG